MTFELWKTTPEEGWKTYYTVVYNKRSIDICEFTSPKQLWVGPSFIGLGGIRKYSIRVEPLPEHNHHFHIDYGGKHICFHVIPDQWLINIRVGDNHVARISHTDVSLQSEYNFSTLTRLDEDYAVLLEICYRLLGESHD